MFQSSSASSGDENQPGCTNARLSVSAALAGNLPSTRRSPHGLRGGGHEPESTPGAPRRAASSADPDTNTPRETIKQLLFHHSLHPTKPSRSRWRREGQLVDRLRSFGTPTAPFPTDHKHTADGLS